MATMTVAAADLVVRRTREHRGPGFLAPPDATDQIEVIDLDTAEAVLFWDCPARVSGRLLRRLRTELHRHDRDEFLARWASVGEDELARLG